jgi:cell division protein FtsB
MLFGIVGSFLRPIAAIAALAGLAAYATIMLRGPQGLNSLSEKQREIRVLEEQNANLQRDIDAKKQRIQKLKSDPSTQELELEKLGYVHQHDTQFKVTDQRTPSATGSGPSAGTPAKH